MPERQSNNTPVSTPLCTYCQAGTCRFRDTQPPTPTSSCRHCGNQCESHYTRECNACEERLYFICNRCEDRYDRNELRGSIYEAGDFCPDCVESIADYHDERRAGDYSSSWGSQSSRAFYSGGNVVNDAMYMSLERGPIVNSSRIFSAEIECYSPNGEAMDSVYAEIAQGIGCTTDGSLDEGGKEFQTPKLKGKKGEQVLTTLCNSLNKHGFEVNNDCGLHIHLDGRGLMPRTQTKHNAISLKQLWAFYLAYEPVIQSFLPPARRDNRYCNKLAKVATLSEVAACYNQRDIDALWYKTRNVVSLRRNKSHHYHDSRYTGINLHSLLGERHLEVRYHSGTLNAQKILHWVNLHTAILDKAARKLLPIADSERGSMLPLHLATERMFDALGLSQKTRDYLMRRQAKFTTSENESALTDKETTQICAE